MNTRFHKLKGPSTHLGVYFTTTEITAVKSIHSESSVKVIDSIQEPLDSKMHKDMNLFSTKLRQVLEKLIKKDEQYQLWTSIPDLHLFDLHLQMPALPDAQQPAAALWHYQQNSRRDLGHVTFDYELHETISGEEKQLAFQGFTLPIDKAYEIENLYKTAGFELTGITPQYVLWTQLFKHRKNKNGVQCLIQMDSNGCHIRIYNKNTEIASRHLVYNNLQLTDIFRKYQPHLSNKELNSYIDNYRFNPEQDSNTPQHQEIATQLSNLWQRVQQTNLIIKKQHDLTINSYHLCGNIVHHQFINDFIAIQEKSDITHSNLHPSQCTPTFQQEQVPPEEALALSLCDNTNTVNFLYPKSDKEDYLKLAKKSQHIYASLLLVLITAICFGLYQHISTNTLKLQKETITARTKKVQKDFQAKKETSTAKQHKVIAEVNANLKKFSILATLNKTLRTISKSEMPLESIIVSRNPKQNKNLKIRAKVYHKGEQQEAELAAGKLIDQLEQKAQISMNRNLQQQEINLKEGKVILLSINGSKQTHSAGAK